MNTKLQIYYNNKHGSTPQASKRKKGMSDEEIYVHWNIEHLGAPIKMAFLSLNLQTPSYEDYVCVYKLINADKLQY